MVLTMTSDVFKAVQDGGRARRNCRGDEDVEKHQAPHVDPVKVAGKLTRTVWAWLAQRMTRTPHDRGPDEVGYVR